MSVQDYASASKLGKKRYHACMNKGRYPYLPVLENIISDDDIDCEVSLGEEQIPLRLVVGTCNAARTNAFADNFMPILDWGTEFSAKWASLSDSQMNEGIRDAIKVYEYMNKFYVLEGNKRVSVLKYFNAVTVNAEVIRKVPKKSDNTDVKIYYEFMEFHKCTNINDIYFSTAGCFPILMKLVGIEKDRKMDEEAKMDFVSCFLSFRNAFEARGGDKFDYPVGDAFLRFIHIHGYETVKNMGSDDMAKNVAKTWAEFELLSEEDAVALQMDPVSSEPRKNILSYLLPRPGSKRLKVGFIYEHTPQDSEWCYAHELGRQYIDDIFGNQIETVSMENVTPELEDEKAIEEMAANKADLIFVTSPSMIMASVKEAIAHPQVKILNCTLNSSHKYIRTYYARMYEAKFLGGVIAGILTSKDKIGYVASYPVFGMLANINAFALGVKYVNPRARVYLEWSSIENAEPQKSFEQNGIDYVSDQDMITPKNSSRKFGLYSLEADGSRQHIAMTVWHWGVFYEKMIQSILGGSWKYEEEADTAKKALSYWWGMSAQVVDIIISSKVPDGTVRLVEMIRKQICQGEFDLFSGKLCDQDGNLRNSGEKALEPDEIITMDWLLDNIEGSIPTLDMLDEHSRAVTAAQWIGRSE